MAWADALVQRNREQGNATLPRMAAVACAILFGAVAALGQTRTKTPVLLTRPSFAPAAPAHPPSPTTIELMVPKGTPIRISLLKDVRILKIGAPVTGRVLEPVYSFDRVVVPKGSVVTGKVMQIVPVSKLVRTEAILNGDFTPLKKATVEFDTLVLKNGRRVPLDTDVLPGTQDIIRLVTPASGKDPSLMEQAKRAIDRRWRKAIDEVKAPGKMHRLKELALSELPYHRQYLKTGTVYDAVLCEPLKLGKVTIPPAELAHLGGIPPEDSVVDARLLTSLNSATAIDGAPVEAVVTKPLFSRKDSKTLLLPQGTELQGDVVQARPARRMHRNGQLRFVIQKMELPSGSWDRVDASVEGLEVGRGAHLKLDSEGGTSVTQSKTRFLTTALSLAVAATTVVGDSDHHMSDLTGKSGPTTGANGLAGASGFRLVGLALGAGANSRILASALGFYGAARAVYYHFIARGHNVRLAKDTPMEIAFGPPLGPAVK